MALTFTQLVGEVGTLLDLDVSTGSEGETSVKRAVNWGAERVWNRYPWPETRGEYTFSTIAPYSTGTATTTNASTAVTGSGTTWSSFTGRKFAIGYGVPFYRISANGSTTSLTLARSYLEASGTNVPYLIYQDEYDLPTDVAVLTQATLLYTQQQGQLLQISTALMDSSVPVQPRAGPPQSVALCMSTTTNVKRIRMAPIPDTTYGITVRYQKSYTQMSGSSDTTGFATNKEYLVIMAACLYAQRISDARQVTSEEQVESLMTRFWRDQQDAAPLVIARRPFDLVTPQPWVYLNPS